jgi:hypothetical protein
MSNPANLLQLADLNLAEQLKLRTLGNPNAKLLQRDGLLGMSVGSASLNGYLNGLLAFGDTVSPQTILKACDDFLQLLGHGFVLWIRDHSDQTLEQLLKNNGLAPWDEPGGPAMVNYLPVKIPAIPDGVEVRIVSNEKDVLDYAKVAGEAFETPFELNRLAFASVKGLAGTNITAFIASSNGKALSVAMAIVVQGLGGIYNVGTVSEARRRGLGALCTALATNAAFDLGAQATILQASPAGERVYTKLGYKTFTRYRWYNIVTPLAPKHSGTK